jgi:hypothetical protein
MFGKSAGAERVRWVELETHVALCRALGSEPPPAIVNMCGGGLVVQLGVV